MNRSEIHSVRSIFPVDTINELRRARAADPPFDEEIHDFRRRVEEDNRMDKSYKMLLLCLADMDEDFEPQKEMLLNSNKECDSQPRRKMKRVMEQDVGHSNQMPGVESKPKDDHQHNSLKRKKCLTQRILTDEVKVEKMKYYSPSDLASYPEFIDLDDDSESYPEYINLDDDHNGYIDEGKTVANDENCSRNDVKKDHKGDSDSDVEILDSEAIIEGGSLSTFVPSRRFHNGMEDDNDRSREADFRKQVLDVLKKPFDKEEYMRHREAAKHYLDHYPDLEQKLAKCKGRQAKRLTVYRGFFFWLQNLTLEGSFRPWTDRECLAVELGYL